MLIIIGIIVLFLSCLFSFIKGLELGRTNTLTELNVLTGEDAIRFQENLEKAKDNPVSEEEYLRAKHVYETLMRNSKTPI